MVYSVGFALTGVLYGLCFPPFNLGGFLAWIAFVPFLLTLKYFNFPRKFLFSWVLGSAAGGGMFYWIVPTCRAGGVNFPMSVAAWAAMSIYTGLYWGIFTAVIGRVRDSWAKPFYEAAVWTALEFLRAHFLTGFPWLLIGYSQWSVPKHLPLAEIGGPYAVGFLVMLFNGVLSLLIIQIKEAWVSRTKKGLWSVAPSFAGLVLLTAWSVALWRRPLSPLGEPLSVAVVQGNIDQYKKWDKAYEDQTMDVYSRLTREAAALKPDLIVWPETAVPGWLPNEEVYLEWVKSLARDSTYILVGAASRENGKDYNAAFLFSPRGEILGRYFKQHLVPFGEYVPFQKILGRFTEVLNEMGDFDSSDEKTVFVHPEGNFSANICFEDIFPDLTRKFTAAGARFQINMTNDGWYMATSAPEQHFIHNVLRAVETRSWVVRAANTGISGFIDPAGRVASKTKLLEEGILVGSVAPMEGNTFYVRRGDVFAWGCVALAFLGFAVGRVDRRLRGV